MQHQQQQGAPMAGMRPGQPPSMSQQHLQGHVATYGGSEGDSLQNLGGQTQYQHSQGPPPMQHPQMQYAQAQQQQHYMQQMQQGPQHPVFIYFQLKILETCPLCGYDLLCTHS